MYLSDCSNHIKKNNVKFYMQKQYDQKDVFLILHGPLSKN